MEDFVAIKEQIRNQVDLVDLVSEHVTLRPQGRNHVGLCPFHQEKTPSFSVNSEGQFFKCFGCNAGGDIFTFVQLRESVDFGEALRILADRAGVELRPTRVGQGDQISRVELAKANDWALRFFRKRLLDKELGQSARQYLTQRGISEESAEAFSIGLATGEGRSLVEAARAAGIEPRHLVSAGLGRVSNQGGELYDAFRDRLMFPIRDSMRRCVGFGGRTLTGDAAKYINTSQTALFDKSKCLYGIDLAREAMSASREAVVVEGYTDCIIAHQYGFKRAVATLGTAATDAQMSALRRFCDSVVLVFDSDEAGDAAADRALAVALKHNLSVRLASVPSGKDPADFLQAEGGEAFGRLLKSAESALVFQWNRTCERYQDVSSAAKRREAVLDFVTLVASLVDVEAVDAIQLGEIVNQLSNLLSVKADDVRRLLASRRGRSRVSAGASSRVRDGGAGETGSARGLRGDGEQAALVSMLEVLLNAPQLYARVSEVFAPERFSDAMCLRIAERVKKLSQSVGAFQLADLLAQIEDPAEASVATDLAERGSRLDLEATLNGVLNRLIEVEAVSSTKPLRAQLRDAAPAEAGLDAATLEQLARFGKKWGSPRHFTPRGLVEERCDRNALGQ